MGIIYDPYAHRSCGDCAHYGEEVDGECEIFNEALASLPQGFGEMEIPHTTSKCHEFKPSDELLRDLADMAAQAREDSRRERAWMTGAQA